MREISDKDKERIKQATIQKIESIVGTGKEAAKKLQEEWTFGSNYDNLSLSEKQMLENLKNQ